MHRAMVVLLLASSALGQAKPRARDLGVPFDGTPGPLNAITDVAGVEVGQTTLIAGEGKLVVGTGPVRTGVTAILPRGHASSDPVFAAWFSLNGNGEMTGTTWVEESGFLEGPVMITNTHSVGVVRDAIVAWRVKRGQPADSEYWWSLPVVAETWDGYLNDINGFHVKPEHVFDALDSARPGAVPEGNVGGGTGMVCHEFKGGIGTASRVVHPDAGGHAVGVLVQANHGRRRLLRIDGVPVGEEIPTTEVPSPWPEREPARPSAPAPPNPPGSGSIIIVVATDAPLLPHQCDRLAQRAGLGMGRVGGIGAHTSGDLFLAFATGNRIRPETRRAAEAGLTVDLRMISDRFIDPFYEATIEATEEAIVNALVAAETTAGRDGHTAHRLPHDRLLEAMARYGRPARR